MGRRILVALTLITGLLIFAVPRAAAAADFTWSSRAYGSSWSDAANWAGNVAPQGSVGTLSFPALAPGSCPKNKLGSDCYWSENDLSGVAIDGLSFDAAAPYWIHGNGVTLGAGGVTATTSSSTAGGNPIVSTPLTLAGNQTWSIDGGPAGVGGLSLEPTVTGSGAALAVRLSHGGHLRAYGEVGPVTITGADPTRVGFDAQSNGAIVGGFNAADGNPISLNHAALQSATSIGPLTSHGGLLRVDPGNGLGSSLPVGGGVTLDSASAIEFGSTGADPYARGFASQFATSVVAASGPVALEGAQLRLYGGNFDFLYSHVCPILAVGTVDTLISTSSPISGTFSNLPDGAITSLDCLYATPPRFRINYSPHAVTATVLTSSSYPTVTQLVPSPSGPKPNQPVTLTASIFSWDIPISANWWQRGTVSFTASGRPIAGCEARLVTFTFANWMGPSATCETSFGAEGLIDVAAHYTPADPSTWQPSDGSAGVTILGDPPHPTLPITTPPGRTALPPSDPGYVTTDSITGLGTGNPTLQLWASARKGAPGLRAVALRLPPGLGFAQQTALLDGGAHVAGVSPATEFRLGPLLVILLPRPISQAHFTITGPVLKESKHLVSQARRALQHSATKRLSLSVTVWVRDALVTERTVLTRAFRLRAAPDRSSG